MPGPISLRLPATSANLGPGFDALGLAMDFALEIDAREASSYSIRATGHNADKCGNVNGSLVLRTYRSVMSGDQSWDRTRGVIADPEKADRVPLHLEMRNGVPLGMGCGSSAAALVAGVALANHFGELGMDRDGILVEASRREGHPDNVAACVLGGLAVSSMATVDVPGLGLIPQVNALSIAPAADWPLLIVMPNASLATSKARALLPANYSKADAIANVQNVALLTTAFAQGAGDLLKIAMADRMHQPYRSAACPLLPLLQPLAGHHGILGVALSGAGPSVLLIVRDRAMLDEAEGVVRTTLGKQSFVKAEIQHASVAAGATLFP